MEKNSVLSTNVKNTLIESISSLKLDKIYQWQSSKWKYKFNDNIPDSVILKAFAESSTLMQDLWM